MSRLVSDRQDVGIGPQHIGDACVFQAIKLDAGRELQLLSQNSSPVVSEHFLVLSFRSWAEPVREEIVLPWVREDVEIHHQLDDMSRQRNHGIIAVLRVLAMQTDSLSLDVDIADSEIGHLSRSDEEVVDNLTCQQIVPVVLHQIIPYELHSAVWYDISAFLLPVLDTFQAFCRVLRYIPSS